MHLPSLLARFRRPTALFALALSALGLTSTARAITNDELLPANLIGKAITFTNAIGAQSTLEPSINSYTISFTSATTYTRVAPGLSTTGTYSVVTTDISGGSRATILNMANGWYATGNTIAITLSLAVRSDGLGGGSAFALTDPSKVGAFTFVFGGTFTPGGGVTNAIPALTSAPTATGTIGTPFTYQITATNSPTRYAATGLPAGLTLNTTTGLISGTPTGSAANVDVTISAINAAGTTTVPISFSIAAGATGGGNSNASLQVFGLNQSAQNDVPAGLTGVISLAIADSHCLALKSDGTVVMWGTDIAKANTVPAGLSGVVAISAQGFNSMALRSNGTVVAWGDTRNGQTIVPAGLSGVTAIACGGAFSLALKSDGTVVSWGSANTINVPAGLTGVVAIAAGGLHGVALKSNGTVVAWGVNTFGQVNVPAGLSGVASLSANTHHNLALKTDGTLVHWGYDPDRSLAAIPAGLTGVTAIACGGFHNIALKSNGTIVGWGFNNFGQTTIPANLSGVTRIAAGGNNTGALIGAGGGTTPPPTTTVATAPTNLVGYRNKVGGVYQFTVTGAARGAIWGTDVYTDDSTLATAAVHAGVLADGATGTVTVTILPGQSSYPASARNGVSSASWGSWSGSYSFAGAGAVSTGPVATARPAAAPGFVAGTTALATGGRLICPVSVTGGGVYTYRWYLNGVLINGATANPYVVESLTAANAGTYSADVTNSFGTTRVNAGTVTVGNAGSPVLALQPISKTIVPGATFTLAANASGSGLTYQWLRNGTTLAGETGAILLRNNASANDAGNYSVRISNSSGTVTSSAATVTLSANASRPANISVRTNVATGTLVTPGFVVQGSGSKRVLIRAVGPGLAAFGLGGTMADPKFTVYQGSTIIATNDDWSAANIGQAFTATGAFNLPAGSKDAALVTDLAAGKDYTVQVTNASGNGGIVLVEVYDADALKGTSTSKLVNVSVRGQTAPGDDVLTLGLVILGQGPRTLLVRGIGPKLASFGVTGTVPDPRLQIVDSQGRIILANDDWASADFVTELALATTYVGAFSLDAGSKDAATLSLVDPGAYTIQVSGTAANPTGEALVEVYEVP